MGIPGRLDLCPFELWPPQAQCVIALDPTDLLALQNAAPHRAALLGEHAAPQRRLEYLASRAGAAALLQAQGAATVEVIIGSDRSPLWPHGFTGSISHSRLLACVAVQPLATCASMGLDVQALLGDASAREVLRHCLRSGELGACGVKEPMSTQTLLTLVFSAKEAFFKCVYGLVRQHFDYTAVQVTDIADGQLQMRVVDSPAHGLPAGFMLRGSYCVARGHVFTAFELPARISKPSI